jgi:hypothetical protein
MNLFRDETLGARKQGCFPLRSGLSRHQSLHAKSDALFGSSLLALLHVFLQKIGLTSARRPKSGRVDMYIFIDSIT